jgi:L-fuculose-phosphate aldolase
VLPFVSKTNVIILANHGTVSYGEDVERAYWWTEILDAYCRILMLARDLGRVHYFSEQKERELLELKQKWGWSDPRNTEEYKNCDVCANDIFRDSWKTSGVQRKAFDAPPPMGPSAAAAPAAAAAAAPAAAPSATGLPSAAEQERLVQMITDRVLEALRKS